MVDSVEEIKKKLAEKQAKQAEKAASKGKQQNTRTNKQTPAPEAKGDLKRQSIEQTIPKGFYSKEINIEDLKHTEIKEAQGLFPDKKETLNSLAASIMQLGLQHNIVVRESADGKYEILAGNTRTEAVRMLHEMYKEEKKYFTIKALVYPLDFLDEETALEIFIDTNIQGRGTYSAKTIGKCLILKYKIYKRRKKEGGEDILEKLAEQFDIKRTSIFMYKAIGDMNEKLVDALEAKGIKIKSIYKLSGFSDVAQQKLYENYMELLTNDTIGFMDKNLSLEENIKIIEANTGKEYTTISKRIDKSRLKDRDYGMLIIDPAHRDEVLAKLKEVQQYIEFIN